MNTSLPISEFETPDFISIRDKLKCEDCYNRKCWCSPKHYRHPDIPDSRYDCEKFLKKISIIKIILEILLFALVIIFTFTNFKGFWLTTIGIALTFTILLVTDILTDKLISYICISLEERRKHKYSLKVEKLKKENESIKMVKDGITEEMKNFLDNSKYLFDELNKTFESTKDKLNMESKMKKEFLINFKVCLQNLKF